MVSVRRMKPQDEAEIKALMKTGNISEDIFIQHNKDFVVFIDEDKIKGIGCSVYYEKQCYVNCIYIEENDRRNGYGSLIVKFILNAADLSGITKVYLHSECSSFAKSLRFQPIEIKSYNEILKKFEEIYKQTISDIYEVALDGYFTSCSCKTK